MKYLVKGNKVLAAILSLVVLVGAAIPVNAASADVNIEVKATDLNMHLTVPTTIPIIFNEDGSNTCPSGWKIENDSSITSIHLAKVDMVSTTGWTLLADSEDTKQLPADTKAIRFYVGKAGDLQTVAPISGTQNAQGSVAFGATDIVIASEGTQVLSFNVDRGAFTTAQASSTAFDMELTFDFNE